MEDDILRGGNLNGCLKWSRGPMFLVIESESWSSGVY